MGLMFLLTLVLVVSVFVIRSRIIRLHDSIEHRFDTMVHVAEKGGELSAMAGSAVFKGAKKAFKKAKQ